MSDDRVRGIKTFVFLGVQVVEAPRMEDGQWVGLTRDGAVVAVGWRTKPSEWSMPRDRLHRVDASPAVYRALLTRVMQEQVRQPPWAPL